jgi:hypothetical protein
MDDIEAIKQLKARYFRTLDTKDWSGLLRLCANDIVADTTESGGNVIAGADQFVAFLRDALADVVTVHHGHMPEISLTSPTTATGIWALQDFLMWPDGRKLHGYGHYHETYTLVEREWRIKTLRLTRLHMDVTGPG